MWTTADAAMPMTVIVVALIVRSACVNAVLLTGDPRKANALWQTGGRKKDPLVGAACRTTPKISGNPSTFQ